MNWLMRCCRSFIESNFLHDPAAESIPPLRKQEPPPLHEPVKPSSLSATFR